MDLSQKEEMIFSSKRALKKILNALLITLISKNDYTDFSLFSVNFTSVSSPIICVIIDFENFSEISLILLDKKLVLIIELTSHRV